MSEAIFGLVGVLLGGAINILTSFILTKNDIKEKKRLESKAKFDNHSRVFRKIVYEVDKYLDENLSKSFSMMESKEELKKETEELLLLVESIDDTLLDGHGIKGYYNYLDYIRAVLKYTHGHQKNRKDRLNALDKFNKGIKKAQIDKKIE